MALNPKMKAYIDEQVSSGKMSADYARQLGATMGDAPDEFQGGWLRQNDYDRAMNQARSVKEKWETWGTDAENTLAENAAALQAANGRVAELEARLSAGGLPEMTHDDLVKQLTAMNEKIANLNGSSLVTKEEMARQIEAAKKEAKVEAVGFMGNYHSDMEKIKHDYQTTFGKSLAPTDADAIVDFANTQAQKLGRVIPLNEAYEMKFADEKRKTWETNKEAEIRKQLETNFRTPTGSFGGSEMGPLQMRMKELEGGNKDWTASNSLAEAKVKAAQALREGGAY